MSRIPRALRDRVRKRAGGRCEYCGIPEEAQLFPFHVEHIISQKHGGHSKPDNLAWSCFDCNVNKGTDVAGYDEESSELTPLFNPRKETWSGHFEIKEGRIVGISPVGRVTVQLLKLNLAARVQDRIALSEAGIWQSPE